MAVDNFAFTPLAATDTNGTHLKELPEQNGKARQKPGSVMSFHNVTYSVEMKQARCGVCRSVTKKAILNDVSGILKPGLNAIMGPTGSGKSTLLDVLAKRKDPKCVTGNIFLDRKYVPDNFQNCSGYVIQNDRLVGTTTVREALWFCANLRLPTSLSQSEKKNRIEKILTELGLSSCADTRIGTELIRGISGGERKRTSIALELILEPKILFLDEPTTGLDAATANSVVQLLKRLGDRGHTIVFSIHQPRYGIFKLFDRLVLLSEGKLVFHGHRKKTLTFFEGLGYVCENHDNPADFFLDVLNGEHEPKPEVSGSDLKGVEIGGTISLGEKFRNAYECSAEFTSIRSELDKISEGVDKTATAKGEIYATGTSHQLKTLLARTARNTIRDPQGLIGNAFFNTVIGLVFGMIFYQVDNTADKGIQNRLGVMFFICANLIFGSTFVIGIFVNEQEIFVHEHVSGYYRVISYFLAKVFADLVPLRTISPIIFSSITYWMVGLRPDAGSFFIFLLTVVLVGYASVGIGLLYSTCFQSSVAEILLMLTDVSAVLFSGLLVNLGTVMPWLSWLQYLSVARYGMVALSINELRGAAYVSCRNGTLPSDAFSTDYGSGEDDDNSGINGRGLCTEVDGGEFIKSSLAIGNGNDPLSDWDLWKNIVALCCLTIGLYTLTYIQLVRRRLFS